MATNHNPTLGAIFNTIIANFPTYFQTCTNIYKKAYEAFFDECKTGSDNDDPFARSYNWCYGFGDFGATAVEALGDNAPDNFDGITRAPRFYHFKEMLFDFGKEFGTYSFGWNGSRLSYFPVSGNNCTLKVLRSDNSAITNNKLKYGLQNAASAIHNCGNLSNAGQMLYFNLPIDIPYSYRTALDAMTFREQLAYLKTRPLSTEPYSSSDCFDIINARQAVSYAEYELRPVLDATEQAYQEHQQNCAECEEDGECDEFLEMYDAWWDCENSIINYIANKCGNYGAQFGECDKILDPYGYYSSSYYGHLDYLDNPLRFIAIHEVDVPTKTYSGNMCEFDIGATWNALKVGGDGYHSAVFNVVMERALAIPGIQYDTAETDYSDGNQFYIKSNLWAWLNSFKDGRKNNDKLWRELQHTGDTNSNSNLYRGYLSCIDDTLRKHSVAFVERQQLRKNTGAYLSTTIARLSYATTGAPICYYKDHTSDEKVGTTQIARGWNYSTGLHAYPGYYQQVYKEGGETALKEARKATYLDGISSYYISSSAGVVTRETVGATVQMAVIDTSGVFVAKKPSFAYIASRPIHRLFPFYLTEKYGVPRVYTKGIVLES